MAGWVQPSSPHQDELSRGTVGSGWGPHFFSFLTPNSTQPFTLVEPTNSRPKKMSKAVSANCPFIRQGLLNAEKEGPRNKGPTSDRVELLLGKAGASADGGVGSSSWTRGPWGTLGYDVMVTTGPTCCWFLSWDRSDTVRHCSCPPSHGRKTMAPVPEKWSSHLSTGPLNGDI